MHPRQPEWPHESVHASTMTSKHIGHLLHSTAVLERDRSSPRPTVAAANAARRRSISALIDAISASAFESCARATAISCRAATFASCCTEVCRRSSRTSSSTVRAVELADIATVELLGSPRVPVRTACWPCARLCRHRSRPCPSCVPRTTTALGGHAPVSSERPCSRFQGSGDEHSSRSAGTLCSVVIPRRAEPPAGAGATPRRPPPAGDGLRGSKVARAPPAPPRSFTQARRPARAGSAVKI